MSESIALSGGMQLAPDGTVSYDFDGHILADGVDMQAAPSPLANPQSNRAVNWRRDSKTGVVVAQLYGRQRTDPNYGSAHMDARGGAAGQVHAALSVIAEANMFYNRVDVFAGLLSNKLLDGQMRSDYLTQRDWWALEQHGTLDDINFTPTAPFNCLYGVFRVTGYVGGPVNTEFGVDIDGGGVARHRMGTSQFYFNQGGVHLPVICFVGYRNSQERTGPVAIKLGSLANMNYDGNDWYGGVWMTFNDNSDPP